MDFFLNIPRLPTAREVGESRRLASRRRSDRTSPEMFQIKVPGKWEELCWGNVVGMWGLGMGSCVGKVGWGSYENAGDAGEFVEEEETFDLLHEVVDEWLISDVTRHTHVLQRPEPATQIRHVTLSLCTSENTSLVISATAHVWVVLGRND